MFGYNWLHGDLGNKFWVLILCSFSVFKMTSIFVTLIGLIYCNAGECVTLHDAVKSLLPEYFQESSLIDEESSRQAEDEQRDSSEDSSSNKISEDGGEILCEHIESCQKSDDAEIKLVRIQGIEPKLEIPFSWVANNLMNPDYFLHICVCLKIPRLNTVCRWKKKQKKKRRYFHMHELVQESLKCPRVDIFFID